MLSCKKSSELIEKKLDTGLTTVENLQLKMHLSMCSACSSYQKQSTNIHNTLNNFLKEPQDSPHTKVSNSSTDELKSRILKSLDKK
ncbi:MAG: zf-HC2 domain-containing protein [Imperialibacter sp.]|uniref:zf-HC2 domain-containing protein n=1 Tax=Imperialibacter sp. TaxID=2038411 RepID=UPI003A8A069A